MIISKTPYRVSFIGGGSDYPEWYLKNGGETISTTINKYLYITCRPLPSFFKHNIRLAYSRIEEVSNFNQIKHPSAREILKYHQSKNIEIHYDGELPKKSGLGSSSAFTIGLHNALSNYNKKFLTKKKLAFDAINFEQNILKETVGSQDQTIISYGGLRNISYQTNGNIIVKKLNISQKKIVNLQNNLFLVYLEKILDNIELEGAYFLNPDQLSDAIINIYANDLETANKIFSDYFIFCALNIVNDHLEESSRFSIYRDKIFEGFFKKYSSEIQFNNYKTNVLSIIENEKSFPLEGEYSSLRFSDQILSHFINLNNLIIEYLKTPSKLNYEKLILNYKNLAEDLEFLKVQKEAKEVISKIKIDEQNLYMKLRVNYLQSISEFNSLLNSKEMQFFHILKDDLIQDNSFRVKILSDEKIYKNFNLEKIENKQLISQIIESIKEAYYIKDVYNNLMLKNYDFVVKNNLKNQIIYENLKTDQKTLISYLSNKMSIVDNKLNISYFLSLFLFSIVSAIIIIGVSHSFKKES